MPWTGGGVGGEASRKWAGFAGATIVGVDDQTGAQSAKERR
jgi:hypothetical protein